MRSATRNGGWQAKLPRHSCAQHQDCICAEAPATEFLAVGACNADSHGVPQVLRLRIVLRHRDALAVWAGEPKEKRCGAQADCHHHQFMYVQWCLPIQPPTVPREFADRSSLRQLMTSAGGTMHHSYSTWACAATAAVQKAIHTAIQPCTATQDAAEMQCPHSRQPCEPKGTQAVFEGSYQLQTNEKPTARCTTGTSPP